MESSCGFLARDVPFVSGIGTPELGSHAKCVRERRLALFAKARLRELLNEPSHKIGINGYDNTPRHRPLINIYRSDQRKIGTILLEGHCARVATASPKKIGAMAEQVSTVRR